MNLSYNIRILIVGFFSYFTNSYIFISATNITVAADDVITLGGADQLALNSGTISDTEAGSTNVPAFLDLSDITAVTQTIA